MISVLSYSTQQSGWTPRHKRGTLRASDGKIFWAYAKQYRVDGSYYPSEVWVSPEKFEQKRQRQRESAKKHVKSEAYKARAEKRKASTKRWANSERGRMKTRERGRTPENVRKRKEYHARPEVKERARQRYKEQYSKPEVVAAYRQKYARIKADPEKYKRMRQVQRDWQRNNKERFKALQKEWRERNRSYQNEYIKRRYAEDPQVALSYKVRARVYQAIQKSGGSKSGRTEEIVGCSFDFLRQHIERQFKGNMSWDNPGSFHIDHIVPLASFDLTDPAQLKVACNWQNLRPIPPKKNMSKGAKLTEPQMHLPLSVTNYTFSEVINP
jgi:hypothetical protein